MIGIDRFYDKSGSEEMCDEWVRMQGKLRKCEK
jgi:hypothetical protein